MCKTTVESKKVANVLINRGIDSSQVFQKQMAIVPPEQAQPGHCLMTGEPLSHSEMYPSGLTPRHMKDSEYLNIINTRPRHNCVMCGTYLDDWKVNMQSTQPREMSHHHCTDCWNYHLLLAGRIHNVPEAFMVTEKHVTLQPAPRAIAYSPQETVSDVINMVPSNQREYVPVQQRRPLPVANNKFYR